MFVDVKAKKGSITVEAALLYPLLCLLICSMLLMTIYLFKIVQLECKGAVTELKKKACNSEWLWLEQGFYDCMEKEEEEVVIDEDIMNEDGE